MSSLKNQCSLGLLKRAAYSKNLSWIQLAKQPELQHVQYHVENCASKGRVKLMLQKSRVKMRMRISNPWIETALFGIRRTPKKHSKKPRWKVRVGSYNQWRPYHKAPWQCVQHLIPLQYWNSTSSHLLFSAKGFLFPTQPCNNRRKFRSQTSDSMDKWKSRGGKSQRREEKKREDQRRERVRSQKMQVREKVRKSGFTAFFQWFVALEGWKVGLLKRRVRSQLARWEIKNCTPLWREAHLQVKMYKARHARSALDVEMIKKCTPLGAKHISKSKCIKHTNLGALFEVQMFNKCTQLWREAHFQVKMYKAHQRRTTFISWDVEKCTPLWCKAFCKWKCSKHHMLGPLLKLRMWLFCGRCEGLCTLSKVSKTWGFVAVSATTRARTTTATTIRYTTQRSTPLHYTTPHYTTLHPTTLNCTTLHFTTLHCTNYKTTTTSTATTK